MSHLSTDSLRILVLEDDIAEDRERSAQAGCNGNLVPGYLDNRRNDVTSLRAQLAEGDFESSQRLGHNMKGTGRGYGFDEITEIGSAIEAAAVEKHAPKLDQLVDRLSSYLSRVRVANVRHTDGEKREQG